MRHSQSLTHISVLALAVNLSGCVSLQSKFKGLKLGSVTTSQEMQKANFLKEASETEFMVEPAIESVEVEMPHLIMDGQMKPRPINVEIFDRGPTLSGYQAVSYANRTAVVEPNSDNYLNAIQLYPYTPGSLYQVYTSPSQVTDIALEKGEALTSVSAGDTERWTVGDTVSGSGANEQVHILVKPMAPQLSTNAVITTTKRTYYLDLKSFADTYMAAVSWRYPHDSIRQIKSRILDEPRVTQASFTKANLDFDPEELRFDYSIKGDTPIWRPTRVFDDGQKIYIEFPEGLAVSEAPPLFITDGDDKMGKLVNYRVKDGFYIVDRLFDFAELRLGEKDQTVVRIVRES